MTDIIWDGKGLPPVHLNVEWCGNRGGFWVRARIVDYTTTQVCLLHHSDQSYKPYQLEVFNISDIKFRPIKSERDKAIKEMEDVFEYDDWKSKVYSWCALRCRLQKDRRLIMCFFHKWGKWEQYNFFKPARRLTENWGLCSSVEYRQRRICNKCGKIQDEYVRQEVKG